MKNCRKLLLGARWASVPPVSRCEGVSRGPVTAVPKARTIAARGISSTAGASPIEHVAEDFDSATGILNLAWNRPNKRNAITEEMYARVTHVLREAGAKESGVRVVVLTGASPAASGAAAPAAAGASASAGPGAAGKPTAPVPEFYSAGNDLSNFTKGLGSGRTIQDLAADAATLLQAYVDAWITFPRLLMVAVNGPAVGIPVTTLPLADVAYASSTATFHTPFTALGQAPEACSSVTFPRLMGHGWATEMLLLGRTINAQGALDRRLVASVHAPEQLRKYTQEAALAASKLPQGSLTSSKAMVRLGMGIDELRRANERECQLLKERWASEECQSAVMAFLMRKG